MSNRYRIWMAGMTLAAAVALLLGVYRVGFASNPGVGEIVAPKQTQSGGVSVSGHGTVKAKPDTAYVALGVQVKDVSLQSAQRQAARRMSAVVDKIRSLGIAEKDIQTQSYDIYHDDEHNLFVVSNTVQVTVRDIQKSGRLLDETVRAGANSVDGISFGIENRAALEKQARENAMRDARDKAQQLASAGGVQLGKPVSISENVASPPIPLAVAAQAAPAGAAPETPVEPGQLEVSVDVQVTYAIK